VLHRGEVVIPRSMVMAAARGGSSGGGGGSTSVRVGDISISTAIDGTGDVRADTQRGREFGKLVQGMIRGELARQSQPGGLLTANGSAGRVGR
jgi:hypothetical protein